MRLIDADKLPATCTLTIVNGHIELTGWFAAERIDEAPTVEAIPVEWIEKYMAEELTTGSIMWQCLKDFVEDWEKEK